MIIEIKHQEKNFQFDLSQGFDISIPISKHEGVRAFGIEKAEFTYYQSGSYIGSVQHGSGSNCETIRLTPHGNGTHTECYGHISKERVCVSDCFERGYKFGLLLSVEPFCMLNGDNIIQKEAIESAFKSFNIKPEVLILRTLPNSIDKKNKDYSGTNPTYLHWNAAQWMLKQGITHLVVDLPSVDREEDHGEMLAHKAFWNYPENPRTKATITELVYIPSEIKDGIYLTDIQIAPIESDASPSRPISVISSF
jgi:arylformamidase